MNPIIKQEKPNREISSGKQNRRVEGTLLYLGEGAKEGISGQVAVKLRLLCPAPLRLPSPSCHCPSVPVLLPLGGVSAWLCGFV